MYSASAHSILVTFLGNTGQTECLIVQGDHLLYDDEQMEDVTVIFNVQERRLQVQEGPLCPPASNDTSTEAEDPTFGSISIENDPLWLFFFS
jgi:hypothetical protein